ncbi:MAG: hypothetical protein IKU30_03360 [Clostridia bacterium]|nr:hypothetical protein [Clostridia bacterium]
MKKLVALILVCFMMLAAVACSDETTETSQATSSTAEDTSVTDESKADEKSETEDSSEASSEASEESTESSEIADESSEAATESSDVEESSKTEDGEVGEIKFVSQFVSWKKHYCDKAEIYEVVNTDPTSLKLSKVNSDEVVAGDIAVFTSDYGTNIGSDSQDYKDFAVIVFEYDHEVFSYVKKSFAKVGKADSKTKIPEDGYVVAIYKDYTDKINAIEALSDTTPFFPHGFIASDILDAKISSAKTAPTLDGKVTASEYGGDVLWDIMPDNEGVSYYQFEVNDYYATAKVYATYDKDNLYVGVIVDSPQHYNVLSKEDAGNMWQYECIQLQFSSIAPNDEYFVENWDGIRNQTAANANITRQTGYAVNEDGETLITIWQGKAEAGHQAVCVRDDENAKTYYEVVIPWSDLGSGDDVVNVKKGSAFGMAISINCGNDNNFRNIVLRDGGGIMGCNDWTKIPTLTLG